MKIKLSEQEAKALAEMLKPRGTTVRQLMVDCNINSGTKVASMLCERGIPMDKETIWYHGQFGELRHYVVYKVNPYKVKLNAQEYTAEII